MMQRLGPETSQSRTVSFQCLSAVNRTTNSESPSLPLLGSHRIFPYLQTHAFLHTRTHTFPSFPPAVLPLSEHFLFVKDCRRTDCRNLEERCWKHRTRKALSFHCHCCFPVWISLEYESIKYAIPMFSSCCLQTESSFVVVVANHVLKCSSLQSQKGMLSSLCAGHSGYHLLTFLL